jgi:hypothetical protein
VRERFVEASHRFVLQQRVARDRQLAAEVEELVLDDDEERADVVGKRLGEEDAERRVELVDVAERGDAGVALRDPAAVAEPGRAVVAGAGRDLGQPVRHGRGIVAATDARPNATKGGFLQCPFDRAARSQP